MLHATSAKRQLSPAHAWLLAHLAPSQSNAVDEVVVDIGWRDATISCGNGQQKVYGLCAEMHGPVIGEHVPFGASLANADASQWRGRLDAPLSVLGQSVPATCKLGNLEPYIGA